MRNVQQDNKKLLLTNFTINLQIVAMLLNSMDLVLFGHCGRHATKKPPT